MKNRKTVYLAELAILVALILLMAFTPLGYLRTGVLEISFIMIPVAVGAIALGPAAGAILGGLFGLTSFIQCFGMSPFGATLLGINPVFTFIVCFPTRLLMGWLTGVTAKALKGRKFAEFFVPSLLAPVLNTILFTGTLFLLFWNDPHIAGFRGTQNVFAFFVTFVGVNGAVEAAASAIISTPVSGAISKVNARQPR